MRINFKSKRKRNWLSNAFLFNLDKLLYRREKRLWVFGAWQGKKYEDNSRYLYEYVIKYHSDSIKAVWLAESDTVAETVKSIGGEAYTFSSSEGRAIARHAGVAIFTNGLDDFGSFPKVGGAKLVFLGHGVGFKRTYNAKYTGWAFYAKAMMDKLFSWIQRDITIATSDYNAEQRRQIAGLNKDAKIIIAGQPRNDVLKRHVDRNLLLQSLSISANKNMILYMPTYRSPSMGERQMEKIVKYLYESPELKDILHQTNSVIIVKLHPLTPHIDIENRSDFHILDYAAVKDNQVLLAVCDMLITDYSSCCVDFALMDKPVIFYTPDHEDFIKKSETLSDEFYHICELNQGRSPKELAHKISNPSVTATLAINKLFEHPSIKGTCYSENVYNAICKEMGLK